MGDEMIVERLTTSTSAMPWELLVALASLSRSACALARRRASRLGFGAGDQQAATSPTDARGVAEERCPPERSGRISVQLNCVLMVQPRGERALDVVIGAPTL